AHWMPRNLDRRVEIAFPVLEPALQAEIREILNVQLADSLKARVLGPDGRSRRRPTSEPALRSQERLYEIVARRARA
ncbi:MAG: polyphosphate kinase 1, partial [Vicinamibacterales bacterium]